MKRVQPLPLECCGSTLPLGPSGGIGSEDFSAVGFEVLQIPWNWVARPRQGRLLSTPSGIERSRNHVQRVCPLLQQSGMLVISSQEAY